MAESNTSETLKVVDFVPEFGLSGDFKKISEYDFLLFNAKIAPVMAIIFMDKGSNQLVPNMGARDILTEIPFSDKSTVYRLVSEAQEHVVKYTGTSVSITVNEDETDWNSGDIVLKVEISGIPFPISVEMQKDGTDVSTFKVINPSLYM